MTVTDPSARVCVGQFAGAQGVRGLVRLRSFTAVPEDALAYGPLTSADGKVEWQLKLAGHAKGVLIAKVEGIADRDAATALSGTSLYVDRDRLPEPDEDEFYYADLIGRPVEGTDGKPVGRILAVHNFGAGDVIEIEVPQAKSMMLPFTRAAVPLIEANRVVIDPPAEWEVIEGASQ